MRTFNQDGWQAGPAGGNFPERQYFPVILGNGTDAMMINRIGVMCGARTDRYSRGMPREAEPGWYKTNRKEFVKTDTNYGTPLCLADTRVGLFLDTEEFTAADCRQWFDPVTATVFSRFHQHAHRYCADVEIETTTFLTDDHLLVSSFNLKQAPPCGVRLQCSAYPAMNAGSCPVDDVIRAKNVNYRVMPAGNGVLFNYELCDYQGVCAIWYVAQGVADADISSAATDQSDSTSVASPAFPAGATVTVYTAVFDSQDAADPEQALLAAYQRTMAEPVSVIRQRHESAWHARGQRARLHLPDASLQFTYDVSQYVMRSVFNRETGYLPMGILPYQWMNSMFWDSWFASTAWLGSNRVDNARQLSRFWRGKLDEARELAGKFWVGGARYGWTTSRDHFDSNPENCLQFHNNGIVFLQVWQVYEACGDIGFLREMFPMLEDTLRFLVEKLVCDKDGEVYLAECSGPDESRTDLKNTDTWTAAVMIKCLDAYKKAVKTLGEKPFRPGLPDLRAKLWEAMNRNVDEHGVLQSFNGGAMPHWGSLIFALFPDHPACENTLDAISIYDEELNSHNSHGVIFYAERIFTWTEYWVAHILALRGDARGWDRLRQCAKFTGKYGDIPERIFYDGELIRNWFLTAHAAFAWALQTLLLRRVGAELHVLDNLPPDWDNVAFENLTTPDGLRVSARLTAGKLVEVKVRNTHCETREVKLVGPGLPDKSACALEPEQSALF